MKKKKPKLPTNSLEARNLARHPMPPPTTSHKDKKKELDRNRCRADVTDSSLRSYAERPPSGP